MVTVKKILALVVLASLAVFSSTFATDYTSGSFKVKDPVIDEGSDNSTSVNFGLGQSVLQNAIGISASASYQVWSGFQYYYLALPNVLTATPDDGEVDLSWTVPSTFLGITVTGYEVGTGVLSGSYTFEDVGNVAAFTKGGLTNGTPYFFRIKAYGPGGAFVVFSNEASATPNGAVTPPPGGGGGGTVILPANARLTGMAYPSAVVSILVDGVVRSTTTAGSDGRFDVTINGLTSGNHNFSLYAVDVVGQQSPTLNVFKTLTSNATTAINDLIIGPTLSLSHAEIKQGETLTMKGYAAPGVPVELHLSGPSGQIINITSNANGYYEYLLNTANINKGGYEVFARERVGLLTADSFVRQFTVGDKSEVVVPDACGKRSDLNCDGRVDLVDFSILLYFWDATDVSKNPRADIDKSGRVGLRDLSIMLYDWTG